MVKFTHNQGSNWLRQSTEAWCHPSIPDRPWLQLWKLAHKNTLKKNWRHIDAHWMCFNRTLAHIITHWNTLYTSSQGHFYVVLQQSQQCVSMCFNVFQCVSMCKKNTLKKHWRHIDAHWKSMCFGHIAKPARNTLRNTLSLVHIAEHIEKSQCAPCWYVVLK